LNPEDQRYMRLALDLAHKARGRTSPNPMVGAILVKDGQVVGEGCHLCAGTPHAEVHAIADAGEKARGATLYVTLEPCSHHGRTGPCADSVIRAGIRRTVVAMTDPNPKVSGCGISRLRAAGIEVEEGVLAAEAAKLNEVFLKWISTRMPFGIMKAAMTLDGKIATYSGNSRWITGPAARERVHMLRDSSDAILVGIGTVLADDPELTVRLPGGGQNPKRIVVDSMARTPLTSKIVNDGQAPTIIAVTAAAPEASVAALRGKGVEVLVLPRGETGVSLRDLFSLLGEREITSVLIEGGAAVNAAALAANVVDKVLTFIAPKIIGGKAAPGPVGGQGVDKLDEAFGLEDIDVEIIGQDLLVSAYVLAREGRDVYRTCGGIGESENCR